MPYATFDGKEKSQWPPGLGAGRTTTKAAYEGWTFRSYLADSSFWLLRRKYKLCQHRPMYRGNLRKVTLQVTPRKELRPLFDEEEVAAGPHSSGHGPAFL